MSNLNEIANKIKKDHETSNASSSNDTIPPKVNTLTEEEQRELALKSLDNVLAPFEKEEEESVVNGDESFETDDDDSAVVLEDAVPTGSDFPTDGDDSEEDALLMSGDYGLNESFDISDETILESMPDIPQEKAEKNIQTIRQQAMEYRNSLILKNGLPTKDANTLALNKVNELGDEFNIRFLKENPNLLNITVNKEDVTKLEFTEEEKKKLSSVKVINLQIVENQKIAEAKVKKVNKRDKVAYLRKMDSNLSHYSVPLPIINDFVSFSGAQIAQLIQTVRYDDMTASDLISEKSSLIYTKLINGTHLRKTDEDGKASMSYTDFINRFMYYDVDMAIYAIVVASSMEETETRITCLDCKQVFPWKYNVKQLLYTDDFTEEMKDKFEDILLNKSNGEYLKKLHDKENITKIVESPYTKNQYYISQPSIARAISVYSVVDSSDNVMSTLARLAIFLEKIMVYEKSSGEYIPVDEEEREAMSEVLQMLPQEELDILEKYVRSMRFRPKFVLKSVCPNCSQKMENDLLVDDLIFLRARDSSVAIR